MRELIEIQEGLAGMVVLQDTFKVPGRIAGVDLAYLESRVFCAAVVLDYESLEIIEKRCIETEISFPYIPTLLAFREAEPIIEAVEYLDFDVLMLDGHGIAHPTSASSLTCRQSGWQSTSCAGRRKARSKQENRCRSFTKAGMSGMHIAQSTA